MTKAVLAISRAIAENVADPDAMRALAREFAGDRRTAARRRGALRRGRRHRPRTSARSTCSSTSPPSTTRRSARADSSSTPTRSRWRSRSCAAQPRGRRRAARPVPRRAARRVPGHLGRADPAARRAVRRASGDGGRRPEPVDLRMARRERRRTSTQFAAQFGAAGARFALSTSWRNGHRILDAANALVAPFAAAARGCRSRGWSRVPTPATSRSTSSFRRPSTEEADAVAALARASGSTASAERRRSAPQCCSARARRSRLPARRCASTACGTTCSASAGCSPSPRSPTSCQRARGAARSVGAGSS